MPLLKGRIVPPVEALKNVEPKETIYTIQHTKEQFRSKRDYEEKLAQYKESIWTCQSTGQTGMTHEEACKSEQATIKLLKEGFPECFEKAVLELVHHSTDNLESLTDKAWRKLHEEFHIGENVLIGVQPNKSDKDQSSGVEGIIYGVDKSGVSAIDSSCGSGSPSSNKENSGEDSPTKSKNKANIRNDPSVSRSPKKPPTLLPFKYRVRITGKDQVVSGVPAEDIVRQNRVPVKDNVKTFVRSFAWRGGFHQTSPWVVNSNLVKKYSLSNKLADIFFSPSKGMGQGRKVLEEKKKTADTSAKESKKRKRSQSQDKKPTNKKVKQSATPKGQKSLNFVKSPKSGGSPKKSASTPQKKEVITLNTDSSEDEMTLAEIKSSPEKMARGTPVKSGSSTSVSSKVAGNSATPKKRGRPTKAESERRKAELEKQGKQVNSPKSTPKKGNSTPAKDDKKMKQATLFEMKKKRGRPPGSKSATPKSTPVKSPVKSKSPMKSPKSPQKTPFKMPPLAARLVKNPKNMQLVYQCARKIPLNQIKQLPDSIRDSVLKRYNKFQEKKAMQKMTPEELEAFKLKKKEEMKEKLRVMMRKRWREQAKRVEDTYLDLKPLPTPKLVETPDGIANEQFGDFTMITQFINCYKALFTPDDDNSVNQVTTGALMKSVVSGVSGYKPTAQVLSTLMQTLLQDGIAEDYTDLDIPLSELSVNEFTASELVRLCLMKRDDDDSDSEDSEDDMAAENDLDLNDEILERLETTEFYELALEEKMEVLIGLCHRLMGSYSVQDYMEEQQRTATDLWKQRNCVQKARNEEKRDEKLKKREERLKASKPDRKEPAEPIKSSPQRKNGCTIDSFYGKKEPEPDTDLISVVKSRRLLAAKAVEEKRKQEREEKLRREKEYAENKKERDRENIEKNFKEGYMVAKWTTRQTPIGTDRNHDRYWLFHKSTPGLFVEKGWANKDILYNTRQDDDDDSSSSDMEASDEEDIQENGERKKGRKKKVHHTEKTFPHTGQNLWFMYDSLEDVDRLIENLHPQGIRESVLKTSLQEHYDYIKKTLEQLEKPLQTVEGLNLEESFKEDLLEMEDRLRVGGLGGVMDYTTWEKRIKNAKSIQDYGKCLVETQTHVIGKFVKGMLTQNTKVKTAVKTKDEDGESDSESVKQECDTESENNVEVKEEAKEDNSEETTPTCVLRWREAVESCTTFSRLYVLMGMLDACIKWEKSAENAKCKICRKKGDEDRLLLCDDCNQAFHLYCMRPALLDVPQGDWLCAACKPVTQRWGSRGKNYREIAGCDSDANSETKVTSRSSRYGRNVNYLDEDSESEEEQKLENEKECARCGGDEGLVPCSTCVSSFHWMCHEPPLRREPRSNWRCFQCLTGVRLKSSRPSRSCNKAEKRKSAYDEDDDYSTSGKKSRASRKAVAPRRSSSRTSRKPPQRYEEYDSFSSDDSPESEEEEEDEDGEDEADSDESESNTETESPTASKSQQPSKRSSSGGGRGSQVNGLGVNTSPSSAHQTRQKGDKHLVNGVFAQNEILDSSMKVIMDVLKKLMRLKCAWPFLEPVTAELVPDYFDVVKKPMDLQTIENKCLSEVYGGPQEFVDDVSLMLDNSYLYNKADSVVFKCTVPMENAFTKLVKKHLPSCHYHNAKDQSQVTVNGHSPGPQKSSNTSSSSPNLPNDHAYSSPKRPNHS